MMHPQKKTEHHGLGDIISLNFQIYPYHIYLPKCSIMYGIFTYIYHVGKYTIHWAYLGFAKNPPIPGYNKKGP